MAWASLAGALAWAPLSLLLFPGEWLRSSVVWVVIAVSLKALALARGGRVRAASWAMIAMVWGVFSCVLVVAGGVGAPARSGYLVLVVMSGVLLGARGAIGSSVVSVVTLGGIAILDERGWLPTAPFEYTGLRIWWVESVYYLAAGVLVAVAAARIREALTSARHSERALDASRRRYQALTENALDPILEIAPDGRILYASLNTETILGYTPEEVVGRNAAEFFHPAERARVEESLEGLRRHGELRLEPQRVRRKNGSLAWVESTARAYLNEEGEERIVAIARDVTSRMQALEAQRASDERFRRLSEHSRDLVAEVDAQGILQYASPNHADVLGYTAEELVGLHVSEIMALVGASVEATRAGDEGAPRTFRVRHRDGTVRWMELSGSLFRGPDGEDCRLSVTRDVTERVRVEEGLRQTQRLESLGVLAGGIAHDFNNLLTAMLGNASLALQELPESSPVREYLRDVEVSATRAAELTGQMLAYAGKAHRAPQRIDLPTLVTSVSRLIEPSIFPGVAVVYDLPESLPPVEIDPAQAQQIVMNLLTNASEAIGEQAGTIRVAAGLVEAGRELLDSSLLGRDLPEGPYVWLAVTDTGCGMDEQTQAHAFDPFFTTKFTGRGLGLAALLGIARSHAATLRVTSQLGRGTKFEMFFPAKTALAAEREEPAPRPASWSEGGVVLVVDDDPLVRAVARRSLEARGLEVVLATGGEEALARVREDAASLLAVVLDLTMPGLDGPATLGALRALRPHLPIILSSGYGPDVLASRALGSAGTTILPKPYRAEDLWLSLERALGG